MQKSKTSRPRDRLSELPDSLIYDIFWLLPMSDVVKTTVLSKRWKNLWTTATCLRFKDSMVDTTDRVRTFVYRALMFWKGSRIVKFMIDFDSHLHMPLYSDIDLWVRFATEHLVEELYVNLEYADDISFIKVDEDEMYCAPQCLYSCSSLKKLTLKGCCNLQIHGNVQWNQLEVLTIDCHGMTEHWVNLVLSGSPKLEVFTFYVMENYENLSIQSSSLKFLFIEKSLYFDHDEPSMESELRIWTPKLESLEISGVPYSKCLLMNVSSVIEAILGFHGPNYYHHDLFGLGNDFLGETLRQILPTIQHVEKLILSDWCIKALGAMKKKYMLPPLVNVKLLELNNDSFEEYEHIVCVLEIFPKLEILVLQSENEDNARNRILANNAKSCLRLERNLYLPNSFLLQLRTVKITWTNGDDYIFPFIEIVLKYASNLKKMVFRVEGRIGPSNSLLLASKKLVRMARSSPAAELIFSEY